MEATNPSFMDNIARQADPIRNKGMLFFSPIDGHRKMPTCTTRDIAEVAADLLSDPSRAGQEQVAVLGPKDLSFIDMAAIASDVPGPTGDVSADLVRRL